jgi:hypothetical protein
MWAWNYMVDYGQMKDSDYPYTATDTPCAWNAELPIVKTESDVAPFTMVEHNSEAIYTAINQHPVAVAINASSLPF